MNESTFASSLQGSTSGQIKYDGDKQSQPQLSISKKHKEEPIGFPAVGATADIRPITLTFALAKPASSSWNNYGSIYAYYVTVSIPRHDRYYKSEKRKESGSFIGSFDLPGEMLSVETDALVRLFVEQQPVFPCMMVKSKKRGLTLRYKQSTISMSKIRDNINGKIVIECCNHNSPYVITMFIESSIHIIKSNPKMKYGAVLFRGMNITCRSSMTDKYTDTGIKQKACMLYKYMYKYKNEHLCAIVPDVVCLVSRRRVDGTWAPILRTYNEADYFTAGSSILWYVQGEESEIALRIDGLLLYGSSGAVVRQATIQCSLKHIMSTGHLGWLLQTMYKPVGATEGDYNDARDGSGISGIFKVKKVKYQGEIHHNGHKCQYREIEFDTCIYYRDVESIPDSMELDILNIGVADNCDSAINSLPTKTPHAVVDTGVAANGKKATKKTSLHSKFVSDLVHCDDKAWRKTSCKVHNEVPWRD